MNEHTGWKGRLAGLSPRGLADWFGGRKWVMSWGIIAIATVALFWDKLDGWAWVACVTAVGAAYGASNVAIHRGHARASAAITTTPSAPGPQLGAEEMDVGH